MAQAGMDLVFAEADNPDDFIAGVATFDKSQT
jgi:hypothetical protein